MSGSGAGGGAATKAAPSGGTASQYSIGRAVRLALYGAAAAGAVLLVVAVFLPVFSIRVGGALREEQVGWERHGPALVLLAVAALILLAVAWRGRSRPAMLGVGLVGLGAALVALLIDLPDIDASGTYGPRYEPAVAEVGPGFYLETLGAVLLLVGGGGLLMASSSLSSSSSKSSSSSSSSSKS